jgi:hypothetical protein
MDLEFQRITGRNCRVLRAFSSHLLRGTEEDHFKYQSNIIRDGIRNYYLPNEKLYFSDYHKVEVFKVIISQN